MWGCLTFTTDKKYIKIIYNLKTPQKVRHLKTVACLKNCVCTVYQYVFQAIITSFFIVVITVTPSKRKVSLMNLSIKNKTHFPSKFASGEKSYSWVNMVNMKPPPPPPPPPPSSSCFVHMYYITHFCKLCCLCRCVYWLYFWSLRSIEHMWTCTAYFNQNKMWCTSVSWYWSSVKFTSFLSAIICSRWCNGTCCVAWINMNVYIYIYHKW